ncbi:MAG TPA: ferritin-like domain-containing protein [Mycobacteriales bacterium]|nr:ferritin-like domain-containing protein [Mycobacteriales bacterium]
MSDAFDMGITERELDVMTAQMDEMHRASLPVLREHIGRIVEHNREQMARPVGRRGVLVGGLTLVGAGALAACGSSKSSTPPATAATTGAAAAGATYTGDLKVVALAAALENLAVAAYGMALDAAGKGTYGTVPPAIATFVTTAKDHHTQHAAGWNAVLQSAGKPAVTTPALSITADQVKMLTAAKTLPDVAKLALNLESAAAQTYTFATSAVSDIKGVQVAATIAPVEAQHAAILAFVLGQYPAPDSFIKTTGAVPVSAFTG